LRAADIEGRCEYADKRHC